MIQMIFSNLGWKLFSLVVAFGLWFFVLSSNSIEVSKEVPLKVVLPTDYMIANDVTDKVTFRLSGSKFFLRTIINSISTIEIDLSGAKPGPTYHTITPDMLSLPIGVKVVSISPSKIYPVIEPIKYRNIPIKVRTANQLPEGMRLLKLEAVPKTARIKGPKSKVERIRVLQTQAIDLSDVRPSLRWEVPVEIGISGVNFDEETPPRVLVEVEPKGSNFRVAGVPLKIEADRKFTADVEKVALYVRCPPKLIRTLTPERVSAFVNLKKLQPGQYVREVQVRLPKGVKLVRVVPEEVKVQLEK